LAKRAEGKFAAEFTPDHVVDPKHREGFQQACNTLKPLRGELT
jgi:hypothetical protein